MKGIDLKMQNARIRAIFYSQQPLLDGKKKVKIKKKHSGNISLKKCQLNFETESETVIFLVSISSPRLKLSEIQP